MQHPHLLLQYHTDMPQQLHPNIHPRLHLLLLRLNPQNMHLPGLILLSSQERKIILKNCHGTQRHDPRRFRHYHKDMLRQSHQSIHPHSHHLRLRLNIQNVHLPDLILLSSQDWLKDLMNYHDKQRLLPHYSLHYHKSKPQQSHLNTHHHSHHLRLKLIYQSMQMPGLTPPSS